MSASLFMMSLRLISVVLASALYLSAAGPWTGIRIVPGDVALAGKGASQRILILARMADGQEEDVTSQADLTSALPDVVAVAPDRLTGQRTGKSTVRAKLGSFQSSMVVTVGDRQADVSVPFSPDVISVLTIKGCNSSGCHGSPAGQNGFKLSLFGYDVAADRDMIVSQHGGRRVDRKQPEQSLFLRKPLFDTPHGGGRLITKDSEEYETLLQWLRQGAKLESNGVRVLRLEAYPAERVLVGKGAKMRVVLIGRLSDGTTRDMTSEVRYASNDEAVAGVSSDGEIMAGVTGLTTVLARGMGQVAAIQVGVINEKSGTGFPSLAANNFVDELVYRRQKTLNAAPAELCADSVFIRRVFLDAIGALPSPEEVERFTLDARPDKRAVLIDALLDRPAYAEFWTVKFEDWFRNNQLNSQGRSMGKFKEWLRALLSEDRPYNETVRALVTSEGDTFQQPAANFWHPAADFMLKKFDVTKVTPTVSRLFMGVRLECAECHNHPLENFTQDDFYGLSAFFARMKVKHGTAEYRRTWFLDDEGEVEHPVTKKPVAPKFLGGGSPHLAAGEDRRAALADWLTSDSNPYFAQALVNRIWHEYFQTGIVEPFDDFRSTNPPTNKELLERLARYFIDSGYRLKALHRLILNSRAYQLSSRQVGPARDAAMERLLFARYQPRQLPAEVLLDAISSVTDVAHPFRNYPPGTRAMEVDVPDSPDYFLVTFGLPRRDILGERAKAPTMSQALHMINGDTVLEKVEAKQNVLSSLLEKGLTDESIMEEIYLRAYARKPSVREAKAINGFIEAEMTAGRSRRRALEGVLWTVLNSKEFQVNH